MPQAKPPRGAEDTPARPRQVRSVSKQIFYDFASI
jgi:hypothetical protein